MYLLILVTFFLSHTGIRSIKSEPLNVYGDCTLDLELANNTFCFGIDDKQNSNDKTRIAFNDTGCIHDRSCIFVAKAKKEDTRIRWSFHLLDSEKYSGGDFVFALDDKPIKLKGTGSSATPPAGIPYMMAQNNEPKTMVDAKGLRSDAGSTTFRVNKEGEASAYDFSGKQFQNFYWDSDHAIAYDSFTLALLDKVSFAAGVSMKCKSTPYCPFVTKDQIPVNYMFGYESFGFSKKAMDDKLNRNINLTIPIAILLIFIVIMINVLTYIWWRKWKKRKAEKEEGMSKTGGSPAKLSTGKPSDDPTLDLVVHKNPPLKPVSVKSSKKK